jgi:hypothetical protein
MAKKKTKGEPCESGIKHAGKAGHRGLQGKIWTNFKVDLMQVFL